MGKLKRLPAWVGPTTSIPIKPRGTNLLRLVSFENIKSATNQEPLEISTKMPKSFEKTRKAIAKKKGPLEAVHEYSRDSKRLHRAQLRDEKLEKIAASRKKADRHFLERAVFFQEAIKQNEGKPLQIEVVQELVRTYVGQHDEELSEAKKSRRPGRPTTAKEDLLKLKVAGLKKEHKHGFLVPELTTGENAVLLDRWEGSWSYLTAMQWVEVADDGTVKPSRFPPKGDH